MCDLFFWSGNRHSKRALQFPRYGKKFLDFGETQPTPPDAYKPAAQVHTASYTQPYTGSVAQEMSAAGERPAAPQRVSFPACAFNLALLLLAGDCVRIVSCPGSQPPRATQLQPRMSVESFTAPTHGAHADLQSSQVTSR